MKNILTIIKKEFSRFFKDSRLVVMTVILPGLMIYALYSFIGMGVTNMITADKNYTPSVYLYNTPSSLSAIVDELNIEVMPNDDITQEQIKEQIEQKNVDLLVIFPENFDVLVDSYDVLNPLHTAPNVELFFNSTNTAGHEIYATFTAILNNYEQTIANKFDINNSETVYDLASQKDMTAQMFANMLPMLLLIFIFSGAMSITAESISGEKERGTIATLLITPIERSQLAIGKVVSLTTFALLSGLSSFIGVIFSFPKLMAGAPDGMSANAYVFADYLMLLGIIMSTVLIIVALLCVVSAFAKSVKEANVLVTPLMIIVTLVGATSMFGGGATTNTMLYLLPIYNSVQAMSAIFSFNASLVNILITVISNLIYTTLFIYLLTKMFHSEKIIFN